MMLALVPKCPLPYHLHASSWSASALRILTHFRASGLHPRLIEDLLKPMVQELVLYHVPLLITDEFLINLEYILDYGL